jgi:hypothetical protein
MVKVGFKLVCALVVIKRYYFNGVVDADMLPLSCCYYTDKLPFKCPSRQRGSVVVDWQTSQGLKLTTRFRHPVGSD